MSNYIIATSKLDVPVSYRCPFCDQHIDTCIKLSEESRATINGWHGGKKAAKRNARAAALEKLINDINRVYEMSGDQLGRCVERNCPQCGAVLPWHYTDDEIAVQKDIASEDRFVLIGVFAFFFGFILIILSLVSREIKALFIGLVLLGIPVIGIFHENSEHAAAKREKRKAVAEEGMQKRTAALRDVPEEYLPVLKYSKSDLLARAAEDA